MANLVNRKFAHMTFQLISEWVSAHRDSLHRAGLALALLVFVSGLALALASAPDIRTVMLTPLLLLLFVGMPVQMALNASEFKLMARYGDYQVKWAQAFRVTIYASAANMLPLPAGVVSRIAALKSYGVTIRLGSTISILGMLLWGGLAFIYSGGSLLLAGQAALGLIFTAIGLLLLVPSAVGFVRLKAEHSLLGGMLFVRLGTLLLEAVRMMLAISCLGSAIDLGKSSAFVVASFLGAAVAIAPSGLGIREAAVAALSPMVGVDPAIGFIAATINRAVGMAGLAATAGVLLAFGRHRQS